MARKLFLALGLVVLCGLTISGARKPDLAISFHLEGQEFEGAKMVQPMRLGSPAKTYYFRRSPELTQRHIIGYYPFQANDGLSWGAAFKMNENGTNTLATISASARGRKLLTVINAEPVDFVILDQPIRDGYIVVWGGLTQKDLVLFDKKFKRIQPERPGDAGREPLMPGRATSSDEPEPAPLKIRGEEEEPKKERRRLLPSLRKREN